MYNYVDQISIASFYTAEECQNIRHTMTIISKNVTHVPMMADKT